MLAAMGLAHALPSTSLAKHRVVPRRAVSPVCALAFDLEQCDLVLSSSTNTFTKPLAHTQPSYTRIDPSYTCGRLAIPLIAWDGTGRAARG